MPILSDDRERQASLRASGLRAGYGSVPVLHDVSVAVSNGEVVCVLGANGSGKSTLLKAITGVITPQSGSVAAFGEDITGLRSDLIARRGIGYVPQSRDVFGPLTVEENLEMGGYAQRKSEVTSRIAEVFSVFPHLAGMRKRRASNLSGGERKLLAIARVLMARPKILILDEPTAQLAPKVAHDILENHIRLLAQQGTTILLVEQRATEALAISDWAYLMVNGSVQVSSPASQIMAREDVGRLFLGATSE
jgi:branched-chain amino acid transport system ATP-binding protein